MCIYVKWVIKRAHANNIKRLYFLARDGWLMYQFALQAKVKMPEAKDIDMRYIHVSRYVLRNAEYYFLDSNSIIDSVFVGGIDITLRKILNRASLTEEEIEKVANDIGFLDRIDECLSYAQIQDLKVKVEGWDDVFFKSVRNHSEEFYESAKGYFTEKGLLEDMSYAIVDSGWLGSTQKSLQNVLSHIRGKDVKLRGFYFGLYDIPSGMDANCYEAFYIQSFNSLKRKTRFSICLFETLFSSPEGMTLGYEKGEDGYHVIQSPKGNPNSLYMRLNNYLLQLFAENLDDKWYRDNQSEASLSHLVELLLTLSMSKPSVEEAGTFGNLLFCDDVLESQMQPVAADWDEAEVKKQRLFNKIILKFLDSTEKLHESGWPEGSIVKVYGESNKSIRALRSERMYKKVMYVRKNLSK